MKLRYLGFCGIDETVNISDLLNISKLFSFVEWGILLRTDLEGTSIEEIKNYLGDFTLNVGEEKYLFSSLEKVRFFGKNLYFVFEDKVVYTDFANKKISITTDFNILKDKKYIELENTELRHSLSDEAGYIVNFTPYNILGSVY